MARKWFYGLLATTIACGMATSLRADEDSNVSATSDESLVAQRGPERGPDRNRPRPPRGPEGDRQRGLDGDRDRPRKPQGDRSRGHREAHFSGSRDHSSGPEMRGGMNEHPPMSRHPFPFDRSFGVRETWMRDASTTPMMQGGMRGPGQFGPPMMPGRGFGPPSLPGGSPFHRFDGNHDGKISKNELLEKFQRADKDGDGSVSREELIRQIMSVHSSPHRESASPQARPQEERR